MPAKVEELAGTNLNLLVALDALLSESSVTRAAQRCGVTQGAMSQSLGHLRRMLGDELLVRGSGGMVTTARAEHLRPEVARAMAQVRRVFEGETEFDPATSSRRFRIASEDAVAILLLSKLIPRLERESPGIDVDFVPFRGEADMHHLETGEIDFAVDAGLPARAGVRSADAFPDDLVAVSRIDHPAIQGPCLDLDAFCEIPQLVVGTASPHVVSVIDRGLAEVGRSRRVALRLKYFNAAAPVVAASNLLWNGPRRLATYFANVVPLALHEIPISIGQYMVGLYWHARFERERMHAWMRERVHASLAERD